MESQQQIQSLKRSLRVVLVLSIIGSGANGLSSLFLAATLPALQQLFSSGEVALPQEMMHVYDVLLSSPRLYYVCLALLSMASLAGVIMMWNLRKNGVHLYTLAQLLMLIVPVLFLGKSFVAIGDIMLTVLFVGFYVITFRRIGAVQAQLDSANQFPSDSETDQ